MEFSIYKSYFFQILILCIENCSLWWELKNWYLCKKRKLYFMCFLFFIFLFLLYLWLGDSLFDHERKDENGKKNR